MFERPDVIDVNTAFDSGMFDVIDVLKMFNVFDVLNVFFFMCLIKYVLFVDYGDVF